MPWAGSLLGSSGGESPPKLIQVIDRSQFLAHTYRTIGLRFLFLWWLFSDGHPQQFPTIHIPSHVAPSTFEPTMSCQIFSALWISFFSEHLEKVICLLRACVIGQAHLDNLSFLRLTAQYYTIKGVISHRLHGFSGSGMESWAPSLEIEPTDIIYSEYGLHRMGKTKTLFCKMIFNF